MEGAPGAGGVVVGVGGFLRGSELFGDVAEVDTDSSPGGGTAPHGVDEDVVDGEMGGSFGIVCFPAFEAFEGGLFVWGVGDGDEWLG